jgi:hypothetical protein
MNNLKPEMEEMLIAYITARPNIYNYIIYGSQDNAANSKTDSFGDMFGRTIPLFLAIQKQLGWEVKESEVFYHDINSVIQNKMLTEIWSYTKTELISLLAASNTLLVCFAKEMLLPHFNTVEDLPAYNAIQRRLIRYMYETEEEFIACNGPEPDLEEEVEREREVETSPKIKID